MAKRIKFFNILRRDLAPLLNTTGLVEVANNSDKSILKYERASSPTSILGLWFQRDVKAWSVDVYGSSFTVEFYRSFDINGRERIFRLFTADELEEMRAIQNRMIARLPPNVDSNISTYALDIDHDLRESIIAPFNPLHDRWMRYRDEEDLVAWTTFLRQKLPDILARFEHKFPA